jgi:hypothetical protein
MRGVYWAGNRMLASREEWRPAAQCIALSHGRKATPSAPRRYSQNAPGSGLPMRKRSSGTSSTSAWAENSIE